MKKKGKVIIISIVCILVGAFAVLVGVSNYFYNVAVKRSTKDFLENNSDLEVEEDDSQPVSVDQDSINWVETQMPEKWEIVSKDGLKLVGYYIPAQIETTKTVILAHGYSSRGKDMWSFAKFYHEKLGYNVLMPDARGHGESDGDYIGFGWPERKDYLLWIEQIIDKVGVDAQIALHGISMGGATVMMVSGEELPEQVKVIVEDCGYTSVYDQLAYQLKRMYNLPSFPILQATSLFTDIKVGYNFYEASALKQVKKNKLPMLFIHGDDDKFVPTKMGWQVFNACKTEKEIFIVEGAGHGMAYSTDEKEYEEKVATFIGRFIN